MAQGSLPPPMRSTLGRDAWNLASRDEDRKQRGGQMMRRLTVLAGVLVILAAVGTAVLAEGPDGKALYQSKCASCHGADGVAKEVWAKKGAHNFNDPAWQKEKSDESLYKATAEGIKEKMMPAYKEKLTKEEIDAIVKHIRTLAPSK